MRPEMLSRYHVRRVSRGDLKKKKCVRLVTGGRCARAGRGGIHFGIFLRVHYGGDGDAEVGDWAPEICQGRGGGNGQSVISDGFSECRRIRGSWTYGLSRHSSRRAATGFWH